MEAKYVELILEAVILGLIIAFQFNSFRKTLTRVTKYGNIFGKVVGDIPVEEGSFLTKGTIWFYKKIGASEILGQRSQKYLAVDLESKMITVPLSDRGSDLSDILNNVNDYTRNCVEKNKSLDYEIIRGVVYEKIDALEEEIEATLPQPLYLGLMGTFVGVILGIISLVFLGGEVGKVDEQSIPNFLLGVGLGMIASALGLALTTINSRIFKEAKAEKDKEQSKFLGLIRNELMPSVSTKDNLDKFQTAIGEFNHGFKENIGGLESSVKAVNRNIEGQTVLLEKFNELNITELAVETRKNLAQTESYLKELNASGQTFKAFDSYKISLDNSIEKTYNAFRSIEKMLSEIEGLRGGLNNIGDYLKTNDNTLAKLIQYFDRHIQEANQVEAKINEHMAKVDESLVQFSEHRIRAYTTSADKASIRLEEYFDKLEKENVVQKIADQINSLSDNLVKEFSVVGENLKKNTEANQTLLETLTTVSRDADNVALSNEMKVVVQRIEEQNELTRRLLEQQTSPKKSTKSQKALVAVAAVYVLLTIGGASAVILSIM